MKLGMMLEVDDSFTTIWPSRSSEVRSRWGDDLSPLSGLFLQDGCPSCCPTNSIKALSVLCDKICLHMMFIVVRGICICIVGGCTTCVGAFTHLLWGGALYIVEGTLHMGGSYTRIKLLMQSCRSAVCFLIMTGCGRISRFLFVSNFKMKGML